VVEVRANPVVEDLPVVEEGAQRLSRNPGTERSAATAEITALHTSPGFEAQAAGGLRTSTTGGALAGFETGRQAALPNHQLVG
jgi:hypothetical protein